MASFRNEYSAVDLKAPMINEVTDHDTVVTGTGKPGAKVIIEATSYGQTRKFFEYVDAAGTYMIVNIMIPDGKTGGKQIEVLPKNPVVDTILAGDTKISGVVDRDATVHIKIGDLPEITTTAEYYGKFSQVVDGTNLTQNTKVEVWAVSNNIKSEVTTLTVQ
ncbi:hypothetical protein GKC32_06980 [Lactobacillus curvatus]|nr:hypothetical protein [Latilactobacillus curvatus]MSE24213.1 hypothetical protein [Latilactobacillus curvatus]